MSDAPVIEPHFHNQESRADKSTISLVLAVILTFVVTGAAVSFVLWDRSEKQTISDQIAQVKANNEKQIAALVSVAKSNTDGLKVLSDQIDKRFASLTLEIRQGTSKRFNEDAAVEFALAMALMNPGTPIPNPKRIREMDFFEVNMTGWKPTITRE